MSLPANFEGAPGEELHHYLRNLCIAFKKSAKESTNIDELQDFMEDFLNASKQMNWHHKKSDIHHKEEGEKAALRVWNEFKRYIFALTSHRSKEKANPQGLIDALSDIERLIHSTLIT
jgi:hypothetical protein